MWSVMRLTGFKWLFWLMLSDLLSNKGGDEVWFMLPIYGVSCRRYVDLGFYAERRQVVGRAYQ